MARRLRDVFYLNAFPEENKIIYYGMELREFLNCTPIELNNLLLLNAEYYGRGFSSHTKLEVVDSEEMEHFSQEDVYSYGNFCWIDYNQKENIEKLEPPEIAEMLYLGHMLSPVNSPFFEKLDNRYTYLAHDDGWYCKLYCKYYDDLKEIITNKIIGMASTSKRRKIYPFSEELKEKLLTLAIDGLIIDFSNTQKYERSIEIPIHTIGKFDNMDEMYNGLRRHIGRSNYSASLVHKNKKWVIDYEIRK
ncbi:hypothetical protein ABES25_15935 [Bacillus gobiensis]|uniref:hypothetical protein n=1 Tax=Bacillus gobiensis TaxID=1441095 RepID=UPI003D21C6E3